MHLANRRVVEVGFGSRILGIPLAGIAYLSFVRALHSVAKYRYQLDQIQCPLPLELRLFWWIISSCLRGLLTEFWCSCTPALAASGTDLGVFPAGGGIAEVSLDFAGLID
jgi:hypothetical protein